MGLRVISVSKALFDERWREHGPVGPMLRFVAVSEQARIEIMMVGSEIPLKLFFRNNSLIRIGSGMIAYDEHALIGEKNGKVTT